MFLKSHLYKVQKKIKLIYVMQSQDIDTLGLRNWEGA